MGVLIDGQWHDRSHDTVASKGRFVRTDSQFRNWVTPGGAPGPSGEGGFVATPDRYHLYVSLACPWANRVLIMRALKGLEAAIPISVTNWIMGADGWTFDDGPGVMPDPVIGAWALHRLYVAAQPNYTGSVTVPVLWDRERARIVSNESSEILRMLNFAFDAVGAREGDYYPLALRAEIDEINARTYAGINNGVYRAGFATSQEAYDEAATQVFETLDWLEERIGRRRFLVGDGLTEADIRLFTSLIRFDAVYAFHFKCNLRLLAQYPALSGYTRDIYQIPGVADTVNFEHIRHHYYESHKQLNPSGLVPMGPARDFNAPHGRDQLGVHDRFRPWASDGLQERCALVA